MSSLTKILAKHSIFYFFGRIIPAILGFLSISLFVRLLGTKDYGQYSLIISLILLIGNFSSTSLTQGILRFNSIFLKNSRYKYNFSRVILIITVLTISFSFISWGLATYSNFQGKLYLLFIPLPILVSHILYTLSVTQNQVLSHPKLIVIADILRSIFIFTISLIILCSDYDQYKVILVLVVNFFGNALGILILNFSFFKRKLAFFQSYLLNREKNYHRDSLKNKTSKKLIKKLLCIIWNYGWPISLWIGVSTLLNIGDRYVIADLMDLEAVGIYSSIYDIIYKSLGLLLLPVLTAFHPMVMNEWNIGNKDSALKLIRNTFWIQILISISILVFLAFYSNLIVKLVLGKEILSATQITLPIAAGASFWQLGMIAHKRIEIENKTLLLLLFVTITLFINLSLNYLLIPFLGYIASAYLTLFCSCLYLMSVHVYNIRLYKFNILDLGSPNLLFK